MYCFKINFTTAKSTGLQKEILSLFHKGNILHSSLVHLTFKWCGKKSNSVYEVRMQLHALNGIGVRTLYYIADHIHIPRKQLCK